jgi:hypothetical protein
MTTVTLQNGKKKLYKLKRVKEEKRLGKGMLKKRRYKKNRDGSGF